MSNRRKYNGKRRMGRKRREELASLSATPAHGDSNAAPPFPDGERGGTALFENGAIRADTQLVRQAVRKRWQTPFEIADEVLRKAGEKILNQEEASPLHLAAIGKMYLDVERQNQADEHHRDRVALAERSLAIKAKVGSEYRAPSVGIMADGGNVHIYLPNNHRDDPVVEYTEEDIQRELAKEQ